MRKRIILTGLVLAVLLIVAIPVSNAWSASEGTVSCTVTPQFVSITVSDGSVDYGTMAPGAWKDTTSDHLNDPQTVTNNGNMSVDLTIKSSDATGGTTNWTLATSPGANQFQHCFTTVFQSWPNLTHSYQTLAENIASGGTQVFHLKIHMPTSVTDASQKTITVTVQATAR